VEICGKLCAPGAEGSVARNLAQGVSCGDASTFREFLSACSSCAGDYKDPDRTARPPDREEPEQDDDFPAQEE
jgi:hypothetical protein